MSHLLTEVTDNEFVTLSGTIRSSPIWIGRMGMGLPFGKTINLRVDAVTPLGDTKDAYPPLLRVAISAANLNLD